MESKIRSGRCRRTRFLRGFLLARLAARCSRRAVAALTHLSHSLRCSGIVQSRVRQTAKDIYWGMQAGWRGSGAYERRYLGGIAVTAMLVLVERSLARRDFFR